MKSVFLDPIVSFEGFDLCLLNILIFIAIYLGGLLLMAFLKRFFKKQDLHKKRLTIEGTDIPVFRLVKQLIWILLIFIGFETLEINNPNLDLSDFLSYEFIRFDDFHVAIFHLFFLAGLYFAGRIILSIVRIYLVRRIRNSNKRDEGTEYVYFQLIKYIIISLTIILMMRSMGVELSTFMESILFLSVGVALGMQDIFKDFFSGLLLLFEGSVKVGDIVEIENVKSGTENFIAKILEINVRTSKVETIDGKVLIIPNSHLTFQKVNNWSTGNNETRFMIPVTVHYSADLDKVKLLMRDCAKAHPMVSTHKDVVVRLLEFSLDGYVLDVVFWAHKNFFIDLHKSEIRFAIDKAFKENDVSYPYRQMDIHVKPNGSGQKMNPEKGEDLSI